MRNKRLMLIAILFLAIGFASVSTVLYINGTTGIEADESEFVGDVIFTDLVKGDNVESALISDSGRTITFTTTDLDTIGDLGTVKFKIQNNSQYTATFGDPAFSCYFVDAYATDEKSDESSSVKEIASKYLEFVKPTLIDGKTLNNGGLKTDEMSLSVKLIQSYGADYNNYDSNGDGTNDTLQVKFQCTINATAGDSTVAKVTTTASIPEPVSFATDSWETIEKAVKEGNTSAYNVGDTKTITLAAHHSDCATLVSDMCMPGDIAESTATIRIANMSNPDICSSDSFSKSACGFVVEFVDALEVGPMNTTTTSDGSWRDSYMRSYLNGNFYNALPSDLQKVIASTSVITGHNYNETENVTSVDKLYLLSLREVYDENSNNWDTAWDYSRELDYYSSGGSLGKLNGTETKYWFLRTAVYSDVVAQHFVSTVNVSGMMFSGEYATSIKGISPAFRIE